MKGPLLLFLDCDGVLNTTRCLTCEYSDDDSSLVFPSRAELDDFFPLERSCLERLRRIIQETGAHIVLTTTWRTLPAMRSYLLEAMEKSGIETAAVLGDTPTLAGAGRGQEISCFLEQARLIYGGEEHAVLPTFAILEDDDKHLASFAREGLAGRCVKTETEHGLTEAAADEVICLLAGDRRIPSVNSPVASSPQVAGDKIARQ